MALATAVNFHQREPQSTQLHIPEAITFPRAIHQKGEEKPKPVLLFSGLAQIVLGVSVLITLKMQLEFVLPTAMVACAWLMFTGLSGVCISCYVTTGRDRSVECGDIVIRKSFILCFGIYIGLLVVGVILTAAMAIHGLYEHFSRRDSTSDAWEPGVSCLAFGLLLTLLDCIILTAVIKGLRHYTHLTDHPILRPFPAQPGTPASVHLAHSVNSTVIPRIIAGSPADKPGLALNHFNGKKYETKNMRSNGKDVGSPLLLSPDNVPAGQSGTLSRSSSFVTSGNKSLSRSGSQNLLRQSK